MNTAFRCALISSRWSHPSSTGSWSNQGSIPKGSCSSGAVSPVTWHHARGLIRAPTRRAGLRSRLSGVCFPHCACYVRPGGLGADSRGGSGNGNDSPTPAAGPAKTGMVWCADGYGRCQNAGRVPLPAARLLPFGQRARDSLSDLGHGGRRGFCLSEPTALRFVRLSETTPSLRRSRRRRWSLLRPRSQPLGGGCLRLDRSGPWLTAPI
jgi:hypothetical protein